MKGWQLFKRKKSQTKSTLSVVTSGLSVIGSRPTQQDYILLPNEDISPNVLEKQGHMVVLCDGMGGLDGGETASRICADMMIKAYYQNEVDDPCDFYRRILQQADSEVANLTDDAGEPLNCGTTVTSAILRDHRLYWASVGDSRVYLFRKGKLSRLSNDHSYNLMLLEQFAAGEISEIDMLFNKRRNALISYIGIGGLGLMDVSREEEILGKGDMTLLCSDGLYHALRDDEIEAALNVYKERWDELPALLTKMAGEREWILHDNISVVIMGLQ